MGVVDRNVFGSHEIAYECLADTERTERFRQAITEVVRPGNRVLELGTGTGILAIIAADAGAARVDAYEISRPTAEIARTNVAANKCGDVVTVVEDDVVASRFPGRARGFYDVVVAEMISVGLIEEQLVPALNNVLANELLAPGARCIPRAQVTSLEIVECDFTWFGYRMPTIQIEQTWQERKVRQVLTPASMVQAVDLEAAANTGSPVEPTVQARVMGTVAVDGVANAIRLIGESQLSAATSSGWTQCMNSPAVIPISERRVRAGDTLRGRLAYEMGGEFRSVDWRWI